MKNKTYPSRSGSSRFSSLSFPTFTKSNLSSKNPTFKSIKLSPQASSSRDADFSALPYDILLKISASFTLPNLQAASLVCRSWGEGLRPLREAMLLLSWGKRLKHGKRSVRPNLEKALDSFLKASAKGSALAMVDAGLVYWQMGLKDKAVALYLNAAELGHPAGMCNLGISYLQAEPPKTKEALRWLHKASIGGNARAQYQLALCLHRVHKVNGNIKEAAKWYLKAAEGGYVRAMYNISLCYSSGEGVTHNRQLARKWMKRAADHGHSKAQFEHGLSLFSEGDLMKAVVYLELASRAGERAAARVKNVVLQRLSAPSQDHAMLLVDRWRALPSC